MRLLIATPTYKGKDYAFGAYEEALEASVMAWAKFTEGSAYRVLVDTTDDDGSYFKYLSGMTGATVRLEPSPTFTETMLRYYRLVYDRAQEYGADRILSVESDIVVYPRAVELMMRHLDDYDDTAFLTVAHQPRPSTGRTELLSEMGLCLMRTEAWQYGLGHAKFIHAVSEKVEGEVVWDQLCDHLDGGDEEWQYLDRDPRHKQLIIMLLTHTYTGPR